MSKSTYLGSNTEIDQHTFGQLIETKNRIVYDMATVVVTSAAVPQPNTTNGGSTTGNTHIEGIFTASSIATPILRGGTTSVPAPLIITSNTEFSFPAANGTIVITSNTGLLDIDAVSTNISSNVRFDGGSTRTIRIDTANTTINTGSFFVSSNTSLSGNTVTISPQTLTVTANTVVSGATFSLNSDVLTIGVNNLDTLVVNSVTDFNSDVNIDGLFSATGNAQFSGASSTFQNNVIIGSSNTDLLTINSLLNTDLLPSSNTIDLGTDLLSYGNVHTNFVYSKNNIQTNSDVVLFGSSIKTIKAKSANTTIYGLNFVLEDSASTFSTPLRLTSSSVIPGSNTSIDLGTNLLSWRNLYTRDSFVSNSVSISNALTVTGVTNSGNTVITGGLTVSAASVFGNNLTVSGDFTVTGNAAFSSSAVLTLSSSIIEDLDVLVSLQMDPAARVVSDLIPSSNKNLGSVTDKWSTVYANAFSGNVDWSFVTSKPSPVITINGDASGSATLSGLGSATLTLAIADDSHNHTPLTITGLSEFIQDTVDSLISSTSSITKVYDDLTNSMAFSSTDTLNSILTRGPTSSLSMTVGNITVSGNTVLSGSTSVGAPIINLNTLGSAPTANTGLSITLGVGGPATLFYTQASNTWTLSAPLVAPSFIGTASTATVLESSRNINGVAFNGSANISVPVNLANRTTNESGHLLFTSTTATGNQQAYTNTNIRVNPSSGTLSATNFDSTSDFNLKQNISKIENALEKVISVNGYTFEFKTNSTRRQAGVIAQEIEQILPEVVSTASDGTKSVSYGNLVSILIEAIKDLNDKYEDLKQNSANSSK